MTYFFIRRFQSFALIGVLALMLTACIGGDDQTASDKKDASESTAEMKAESPEVKEDAADKPMPEEAEKADDAAEDNETAADEASDEETEVAEAPANEAAADDEPGVKKAVLKNTVEGLKAPESVIYDAKRDQFYVSQLNKAGFEVDGSLALVGADGQLKELDYITGLHDPHGMAIHEDKIYIADRGDLVMVDLNSKEIEKKFYAVGALYLNDVAVSDDGTVFVSDVLANKIFRLEPGGSLELWMEGDQLNQPNGLYVRDGMLYTVSWGLAKEQSIDGLLAVGKTGILAKIDIGTKTFTKLSNPLGNLDGLDFDEDGNIYISDWKGGKLFHVQADGTLINSYDIAKVIGAESAQGYADLDYVEGIGVVAPLMMNGKLITLDFEGGE